MYLCLSFNKFFDNCKSSVICLNLISTEIVIYKEATETRLLYRYGWISDVCLFWPTRQILHVDRWFLFVLIKRTNFTYGSVIFVCFDQVGNRTDVTCESVIFVCIDQLDRCHLWVGVMICFDKQDGYPLWIGNFISFWLTLDWSNGAQCSVLCAGFFRVLLLFRQYYVWTEIDFF